MLAGYSPGVAMDASRPKTCPTCKAQAGFRINAYDLRLVRRCIACGHAHFQRLPQPNKQVIYIDQFALSEILKAKGGRQPSQPLDAFWIDLYAQFERVLLLQQAVFPASDVHLDESLVAPFAKALRDLHGAIDGDVSFEDTRTVRQRQVLAFARGWLERREIPQIDFDIDHVLRGRRNAWLRPMSIISTTDYTQFADEVRQGRDEVSQQLAESFRVWATEKLTFEQLVDREARAFGQQHLANFRSLCSRMLIGGLDALSLDDLMGETNVLNVLLGQVFERQGVPRDEHFKLSQEFFAWEGLAQVPAVQISAYLFAALARKAAAGQRRLPSSGMVNDVRLLSSYLPYVDAVFIDRECAALLSEEPLATDLSYRARVFSVNTRQQFLDYLVGLERNASPQIAEIAREIYG